MNDLDQLFAELAPFLRASPEIEKVCLFADRWTAPHAPEPQGWAPFHIVTQGACLLDTPDHKGVRLNAGDVAILPHGGSHAVRSELGDGPGQVIRIQARPHDAMRISTNTDGEPETKLICGRMRFEHAHDNMVLAILPSLLVLSAADADGVDAARIRQLVQSIQEELDADRLGSAVIAQQLAGALMMVVLRVQFQRGEGDRGLLALLTRRQSARAVNAMLADPARDWSLDELAEVASTSRATLVRLFRKAVDAPPLSFLSDLRLSLAKRRLAVTTLPLAAIAADIGYQSESAFSRAYHRRYGVPPGADRLATAASQTASGGRP
jgi:AraC family transcriptional activator of mtrCDE